MTHKALTLIVSAALLAGCSTAPTITVPNPLAALNGATQVPGAPGYTTQNVVPASTPTFTANQPAPIGSTYGVAAPNYGVSAPSYSVGTPAIGSSYGTVTAPAAQSLPLNVTPSFGTPALPSYGQTLPAQYGGVSQGVSTLGSVQPSQIINPISTGGAFPTPSISQPSLGSIASGQGIVSAPTSASLPGGVTVSY